MPNELIDIENRCKSLLGKRVRVVYKTDHTYIGKLDRVEKDHILILRDARLIRIDLKDINDINEYHIFFSDTGYVLEAQIHPEENKIDIFGFYKRK